MYLFGGFNGMMEDNVLVFTPGMDLYFDLVIFRHLLVMCIRKI